MSIEKTYKSVGNFMEQCVNTFLSLIKILVQSRFKNTLPITTSDTCIVLGNGPSLKQSFEKHFDFIKQHNLVCVNAFSLSDEYSKLKPAYYVILDPSFWLETNEFLSNVLKGIEEKTNWKLCLLIPYQAKKSTYLNGIKKNKIIHITYFNYTVFKGFDAIAYFFFKKNLAMPQSQNVLVASIFLSINIGFKKIYLVGADHTWHQSLFVDENNQLLVKDVHFYENKEQVTFKPFLIAQNSTKTHRMDQLFTIFGKTFYGYIALNNYAHYNNAVIFNASELSFIDAFKRIKL